MIDTLTARRHASSLTDEELNALIDEHLFNHRARCLGHSEPDDRGIYRCVWCGCVDDRAIASRVFNDVAYGHWRVPSIYTPAEIVLKMQEQPQSTQVVFGVTAKALILGSSRHSRSPLDEFMQILFSVYLNTRAVSIAALTALGVVDEQGMIREDRW